MLKTILFSFFVTTSALAANHGFLLTGDKELYASHIIANAPHNYQIILKIIEPKILKQFYGDLEKDHPEYRFVFVAQHVDLEQLNSGKPQLMGRVVSINPNGDKHEESQDIELPSNAYEILYFRKL